MNLKTTNHDDFSQKRKQRDLKLARLIVEDFIKLTDLFNTTNEFINYKNPKKDNLFGAESEFHGIKKLFILWEIEDKNEKEHLLELTFDMVYQFKNSDLTEKEKAFKICAAWKK